MRSSRRISKSIMILPLTLVGTTLVFAQAPTPTANNVGSKEGPQTRGVTLNERFEGSVSGTATVLDTNTMLGYNFNEHVGVNGGVPMFFLSPKIQTGTASNTNGLGNAYLGIHLDVDAGPISYGSALTAGLPTADTTKNLSTGRVMVDWDNRFDHTWGRLTPYVDIDPGNGINYLSSSDHARAIPQRPFVTLGNEVQFEWGADVKLAGPLTLTASGYNVEPWGPQKVYSLVLHRGQSGKGTVQHGRVFETAALTQGGADLVREHGYNASLDLKLSSFIDISAGYSRSVTYALDTFLFGVGFNLSHIFNRRTQG
jgi:hypothetical protein